MFSRLLLTLSVAALIAACAKTDSKDKMVRSGTGPGGDGSNFDSFVYSEKPSPTQKFNYFTPAMMSGQIADFVELGSSADDPHKLRGGYAVLFLMKNHEYHLFFNTYLRHKNDAGKFCSDIHANPIHHRIDKKEIVGKWSVKNSVLTLESAASGVRSDGSGVKRLNLKFNGLPDVPGADKKNQILTFQSSDVGIDYFQGECEELMSPQDAEKLLNCECHVTTDASGNTAQPCPSPAQQPSANCNGFNVVVHTAGMPGGTAPVVAPSPSPSPVTRPMNQPAAQPSPQVKKPR